MAITEPVKPREGCYTFSQAIALMKEMDRQPTTGRGISLVECKTGKPVSIGYNP